MDKDINKNLTPKQEQGIASQDVTKTGVIDVDVVEAKPAPLPEPVIADNTIKTLSVAENLAEQNRLEAERTEQARVEAAKLAKEQSQQEFIVRNIAGETLGQAQAEQQAIEAGGINQAQREIDELNQAILNSSTALKQARIKDQQDIQALAGQGRGIPATVVRGRQQLLTQQRQAERNLEAIELENDIATSELLQGKTDSARKAIERATELKFADKRQELQLEKEFLSRIDSKEAQARSEKVKREERQLEKAQEESQEIFNIAAQARQAGAGQAEINAILNSENRDGALSSASSIGIDAKLSRTLTRLNIATADQKLKKAEAEAAAAEMLKSSGGLDQETREKISKDKSAQGAVALIAVDKALADYQKKISELTEDGISRNDIKELNAIVANSVAPSLAVANGQGAMTDDERKGIIDDIGLSVTGAVLGRKNRKLRNVEAIRKSQQAKTDIFLEAVDSTYAGASQNFEVFASYEDNLLSEKYGDVRQRVQSLPEDKLIEVGNLAQSLGVSSEDLLSDNKFYETLIK